MAKEMGMRNRARLGEYDCQFLVVTLCMRHGH